MRATALEPIVNQALHEIDSDQLHKDILDSLKSDKFAQEILSAPILPDSRYSISDSGLLLINHRIYVPNISPDSGNLRTCVLQLKHADRRTPWPESYTRLAPTRYTWPNVHTDVKDFVNSCISCKQNKNPRHKPFRLIQQLPILPRPWHSISFDLIEQLPSSNGHTAILNVVDRASKQLICIPTHDKVDAPKVVKLFLHHVFAKHGVPLHVACDRRSQFTSQFFRSLGTLLSIKLHFKSGYNPQADGQSERANQTLEQYLRHYCLYQQDNWADLLPLAEFAYNNALNASTGVSPFFAIKGYHPALDIHPERDVASLHARELAANLDELHKYLGESLKIAQERYQGPADDRRTPPPDITPGDKVFLQSKHIRTTRPTRKLAEPYLRPFEVIDRIGTDSIRLRLPHKLRLIHLVFHVSQIEPSVLNRFPDRQPPPPEPIEIDGELEYELCEILDAKYDLRCWSTCELFYYVQWMGYEGTDEEFQWIAATNLMSSLRNFTTDTLQSPLVPTFLLPITKLARQNAARRRKALRARERPSYRLLFLPSLVLEFVSCLRFCISPSDPINLSFLRLVSGSSRSSWIQ